MKQERLYEIEFCLGDNQAKWLDKETALELVREIKLLHTHIKEFEKEYIFEHNCQIQNAKTRSQWQKGALDGFEYIKRIFDKHFK